MSWLSWTDRLSAILRGRYGPTPTSSLLGRMDPELAQVLATFVSLSTSFDPIRVVVDKTNGTMASTLRAASECRAGNCLTQGRGMLMER